MKGIGCKKESIKSNMGDHGGLISFVSFRFFFVSCLFKPIRRVILVIISR